MSRRAAKDEPIRYVIGTHSWMEGARLSKRGHWGNIPYPSVDEAAEAAKEDAGKSPFVIERLDVRRRSR